MVPSQSCILMKHLHPLPSNLDFYNLFYFAAFSGLDLANFQMLKFLIAWHRVLFSIFLCHIPMALKTIYMLITPKFISSTWLSPQWSCLIYPNYLLDNSMWIFLKHLKLNIYKTKLLLYPNGNLFLYKSSQYLINDTPF